MSTKTHKNKRRSHSTPLEMAQFIDAGSNKIKKRIRDLERLLSRKRDVLPDTIIIGKERTLEALKLELENAKLKQKAKENAKKYHMVRFFERKKALRGYKKALKKHMENKEDSQNMKDLCEKKIDLCYVVNFPKTEKYIALYPSAEMKYEATKGSAATNTKKEAFRNIVARQLEDNTLPVSLSDILKGKKLDKESTGVMLDDADEDERDTAKSAQQEDGEEEADDFFE